MSFRAIKSITGTVALSAVIAGQAAAAPAAPAAPTGAGADAAQADTEPAPLHERGITHRLRGRPGYARRPGRQRVPSAGERRRIEQHFGQVINPEPAPRPPGPPAKAVPKNGPAELVVEPAPMLDGQRRSDPTHPPHPPLPPGAPASVGREPSARVALDDDYALFRSIPVALGGPTLATAEPSVANDRNALLFTGNVHAAISGDNGLSWNAINASTMFPASAGYQNNGGYCCDQVAYAVDRGSYSLIFWLIQYWPDSDNRGRLRLVVFQGRQELLEQSDFCTIDFVPLEFPNRGYAGNTWFDFNQMSATDEFLYISSKVEQGSGTFVDGLVWRLPLEQLDDSDMCEGQTDRDRFSITSWSGDAAGFNPALVQNAGNRMFWASHCKDDPDLDDNENECDGDDSQLVITEVPDSGTQAEITKRDVDRFEVLTRGTGACPLLVSPPSDPCKRPRDAVLTGFRSGGEVGWLWNVRQGGPDFVFPHIRVARFDTTDIRLIDEHDIWNNSYAWIYPAIGVNSAGHIGLLANQMGLGFLPRPAVALIDDVAPDTDWESISFHGIITSTHGTQANVWGDYGQVRAYGNCTGTYGAAVHSQQGGSGNANSEHRFAWFGRERDGCADLTVVSLAALPTEVKAGSDLFIGQTTRNTGSGTADESKTRYFLSRDASSSDDDVELQGQTPVPALGRGTSDPEDEVVGVPSGVEIFGGLGTYYLIACADDGERVVEISNTNNCRVAPDTITVTSGLTRAPTDVQVNTPVAAVARQQRFSVSTQLIIPADARARTISYHLSSTPRTRASIRRIGTGRIPASARRRRGETRRVRVRDLLRAPASVPRRRQYLIACVGTRPRADRCLPARRALYVVRSLSRRR